MTTKVTMPQLGESVVEGTVGKWLVEEGQQVEKDQPIVEILTDKADSEVPAPVGGVVVKLLAGEDDIVAVGEPLCEIDENGQASKGKKKASGGEKSAKGSDSGSDDSGADADEPANGAGHAKPADEAQAEPGGPTSPAVRKLAREHDVDLSKVRGTGDGGRITKDDVLAAADGAKAEPPGSEHPAVPPPPPAAKPEASAKAPARAPARPGGGAFRLPPYVPAEGDEVVPFSRRRRIIADHMVFSKTVAPDVVTFAECDLDATAKIRSKHKARYEKEGVGLTYLAFVCAATVRALKEFPELNARVLDDSFVKLRHINLGIAVDTPDGLVVPVIKDADDLTVRGIARAITDLAERARDGNLTPDDLAGKTFTVSNPGRKGNLVGGAIISQPNVGILRLGTIKKRVVVVEQDGTDMMAIHPVMYMALTYDHRIVDGVHANGFLYRISEILEQGDFEL